MLLIKQNQYKPACDIVNGTCGVSTVCLEVPEIQIKKNNFHWKLYKMLHIIIYFEYNVYTYFNELPATCVSIQSSISKDASTSLDLPKT